MNPQSLLVKKALKQPNHPSKHAWSVLCQGHLPRGKHVAGLLREGSEPRISLNYIRAPPPLQKSRDDDHDDDDDLDVFADID